MKKKRRITFYEDLSTPQKAQVQEQIGMTPEERWQMFIKLRRMYYGLVGDPPRLAKNITISRQSWM